jgi:ketosteroid isomerase-like protein
LHEQTEISDVTLSEIDLNVWGSPMQTDSKLDHAADLEWTTFITKLEAAEHKFAQGRPEAFKALWSHADDVTLCGGFGGRVECGWENVAARLDWASSKYSDGTRSMQTISGRVASELAYVVQTEVIRFRAAGRTERVNQELRVTMVFRREAEGWRIVHRHADSQSNAQPP